MAPTTRSRLEQTSPAIRSLCDKLETLPQELYDQIYEDVFRAPPLGEVRDLNSPSLKVSPTLMQISRTIRAEHACHFYVGKFRYKTTVQRSIIWLHLLPQVHRGHLRKVIFVPLDTNDIEVTWQEVTRLSVLQQWYYEQASRVYYGHLDALREVVRGAVDKRIAKKIVLGV